MTDYSEVPIPAETQEYPISSEDIGNNDHSMDMDSDSLWQQQLMDTEQQILSEKENNKRRGEDSDADEEPSPKKRANEFDKLWKTVMENPTDFQGWTTLLQHVDQVSEIESGRKAYDSFFTHYPYCYGYWKKFAELEKRKGSLETVLKVFDKGLEAIGLSVDLWIHYLDYVTAKFADDETFVREQFEKAIKICGLEFRSDKLWDQYISWETSGKNWTNVTALYDKLLATPISKYMQHWQKFQEHVKRHTPGEVIEKEEFKTLRRSVLSDLNRSEGDTPDEAPPGVETTPEEEQINADEESKMIQNRFIESRQETHEGTVVEAKARWSYEDAIKRPYFHVKPLEKSQLSAWRSYLEFEIGQMNQQRIKVLFERCLIACAFYEEFWMRYIRYLEEIEAPKEDLRAVYVRMCTLHLRDKLRPHLAWAACEEEAGNCDYALMILQDVQGRIPFSLEAYMMAIGVERRRGGGGGKDNLDSAEKLYLSCLENFKTKEDKRGHSGLIIKYARFLTLFMNDPEKAIEVVQGGLKLDEANPSLLLACVDHALACRPPKFDLAADTFKIGTRNYFPPSSRVMFAHRHLHFVTECATDEKSMREALQLLRDVQQEVRQVVMSSNEEGNDSPSKLSDTESLSKKQQRSSNSEEDPSAAGAAAAATQNGTSASSGGAAASTYQNYQNQGYGYNQGYSQGYGTPHYQGWGYPNPQQQSNYNYGGQQNWGGYQNYFGGR